MELNSEEEAVAFTDDCDRFCRWAYRVMGAVVTAGIGRACDSLFTINQSYAGAREAVSYRVLYGTQRAINIGEIAPTEQEISVQSEDTKMHALFKTINLGSREEIEKAAQSEIEKLLDTLTGAAPVLLSYANSRIEELDAKRQTISNEIAKLLSLIHI